MTTNPPVQPIEPETSAPIPRYPASGQPVTRAYRIAFQVWVMCVLLTVVITLSLYMFDKIYFMLTGR